MITDEDSQRLRAYVVGAISTLTTEDAETDETSEAGDQPKNRVESTEISPMNLSAG